MRHIVLLSENLGSLPTGTSQVESRLQSLLSEQADSISLNVRPAVCGKGDPIDTKHGRSIGIAVVIVVDERGQGLCTSSAGVGKDALAARPNDMSMGAEQDGTAAAALTVIERHTATIHIWPCWAGGATVDDAVGAGGAAAGVDRRKVIVIAVPVIDEGAFLAPPAASNVIDRRVGVGG